MENSQVTGTYQVRWGIMATGQIARKFARDLLFDPSTRGVADVKHIVKAVASSSSLTSAESFTSDIITPNQKGFDCMCYDAYADLVKARDVDIIYVATPHSHHFQHVMLCLEAGKAVLCEKPMTVNAKQARVLYDKAKEKKLFLMEAVWTRFFPVSIAVRRHILDNKIGEILRVNADLSHVLPEELWDINNRLIKKDLAGGSLMDIGPYPILWILQTMWHTLPREFQKEKPRVKGTIMTKDSRTGVDITTSVLIEMPHSAPSGQCKAHAIATTAFQIASDPDDKNTAGPAVRIYGTEGEIQVFWPTYRPEKYRIISHSGKVVEEELKIPEGGWGMFWEADEAARCLRDGKLESQVIPWEESILTMELLDEARKQGGLTYPDSIENLDLKN